MSQKSAKRDHDEGDEGVFRMPKPPLPRLHRALTRLGICEGWVCELVLTARSRDCSEAQLAFTHQVIREALRRRHGHRARSARAAVTIGSILLLPAR